MTGRDRMEAAEQNLAIRAERQELIAQRDHYKALYGEVREALLKIEKAALKELKAGHTATVAKENYSNPEPDLNAYEQARIALHDAIVDALAKAKELE